MNNSKIPNRIRELSQAKAVNFNNLSKGLHTEEIKFGQIWTTHSSFQLPGGEQIQTDEPRIIIILEGEGKLSHKFDPITVAPLSTYTDMASEYDFIVKAADSPLAFDFIIEVWNETSALKGQLNKLIGSLSDETSENILQLYFSKVRNLDIPKNLKEYTGLMIIAEDDPRRRFQEEEISAIAYLANAATASLELEHESQKVENTNIESGKVIFDVRPFWGTLSAFLHGPVVARAADNQNIEMERFLIVWPEKKQKIIFELLKSSRHPYDVYIKTHSIANDFIDFACIISVKTKDRIFQSEEFRLNVGMRIEMGKDAHFHYEDVESIEVALKSH